MATDAVRAAARRLVVLHERFAPLFGRFEARQHSLVYLRGLLLAPGRKNVEAIALRFAQSPNGEPADSNEVLALQSFLTCSPWEAGDVMREIQAVFAKEFVPSAAQWPIGTVGVIDESSFEKSGPESCGVKRQWCGRLGKEENCQVGVFLVGVTPAACAMLDQQLYLPKEWASDKARRQKTRVPEDVRFLTKPQIALEQVRRTREAGHVAFDWITADEFYGRNGEFLDGLDALGQRYLVEVPVNTTVWTVDPGSQVPEWSGHGRHPTRPTRDAVCSVKQLAASWPAEAWQAFQLREGAKGPLVYEFAAARVWAVRDQKPGPPVWLVVRRAPGSTSDWQYYLSSAAADTPLERLALVTSTRWRVEEYLEESKGDLGMSGYEARGWTSWHHHMSLVALAHLYVTQSRRDLKTEIPELTLPGALRLLTAALKQPVLTEAEALRLTQYHLRRNKIAHESHRKTWMAKHKKLKAKPLL